MIHQAIAFATASHKNQMRKGTKIPYILHCLEAGVIAADLTNKNGQVDEDVVAAAILHDTIEDAQVSFETLEVTFGEIVAHLVQNQSEDKSKDWKTRKEATIQFLKENTSKRVEIATLADKLSNMRAIARDYTIQKDELWEKFNAGKEAQHWYYQSIADAFSQVNETTEFKEFEELIQKTFS